MAVSIRAYSEVSGQIAYASSVNRVLDDLYSRQAGNLDSANLTASCIGIRELDHESILLFQQVFS